MAKKKATSAKKATKKAKTDPPKVTKVTKDIISQLRSGPPGLGGR